VKRICEILDATLELESQPGVGTTVSVILPRRYPEGDPGR
jgi:signal transduction histidine kinase